MTTVPPTTLTSNPTVENPFSCDYCKSPYVVKPSCRNPKRKTLKQRGPRKLIDPDSKKSVLLCNACGLRLARKMRKIQIDSENKKQCYQNPNEPSLNNDPNNWLDSNCSTNLVQYLGDEDACKLVCPQVKVRKCACIQKILLTEMEMGMKEKGLYLLQLHHEALRLKRCKDGIKSGNKILSEEFEQFVLHTRSKLKKDMAFCERAVQKLLGYSNNFLHRIPTSGTSPRLVRSIGKAALGTLLPLERLATVKCCYQKCTSIAWTHKKLLQRWRSECRKSTQYLRRVIWQLLLPSGAAVNCNKFICMLTGASSATVCSVGKHMKKDGGDGHPLEHGLKEYYKRKKDEMQQHKKSGPPQIDSSIVLSNEKINCLSLSAALEHIRQLQKLLTTQHKPLRKTSATNKRRKDPNTSSETGSRILTDLLEKVDILPGSFQKSNSAVVIASHSQILPSQVSTLQVPTSALQASSSHDEVLQLPSECAPAQVTTLHLPHSEAINLRSVVVPLQTVRTLQVPTIHSEQSNSEYTVHPSNVIHNNYLTSVVTSQIQSKRIIYTSDLTRTLTN